MTTHDTNAYITSPSTSNQHSLYHNRYIVRICYTPHKQMINTLRIRKFHFPASDIPPCSRQDSFCLLFLFVLYSSVIQMLLDAEIHLHLLGDDPLGMQSLAHSHSSKRDTFIISSLTSSHPLIRNAIDIIL